MKVKYIKLINLIVAVLVALFAIGQAFAWFMDGRRTLYQLFGGSSEGAYFAYGSGTKDDPFGINTKYHMYNLAWLQNTGRLTDEQGVPKKYYFELDEELDAPIDMGDYWLPPIGNDENPFIGEFNGNGKEIANLKITTNKQLLTANPASEDYKFSNAVGMFGFTDEGSVVYNFILNNPRVNAFSSDSVYSDDANKVIGLAVGHVGGNCYSIGVRALEVSGSAQKTLLEIERSNYSTFNSILGELGAGVSSSVTGGGSTGVGGSGNAFGASFDVQTYALRLFAMEENHTLETPSYYLPIGARGSNDYPVLRSGERMPFTVSNVINNENYETIYKDMGSKAMETIAENNIGYVLGNQTKLNEKTLTFVEAMTQSNDANGTWTYSHVPDRSHVPMWFYTRPKEKYDSESFGYDKNTTGVEAITIEQYKSLPAGIKNLLPKGADKYIYEDTANNIHQPNDVTNPNIGTQKSYFTIRLSANLTYEDIRNNGNTNNNDWSYHGQISWMGKTYGKGFSDKDGYAVDENGNYYSSTGNLLGADGYDRDADGHYGADVSKFANFPYIVYSYDLVSKTAYAKDENGNRYYAYKRDNGEYVYGILSGGYLKTGDGYNSYAAPIAGWSQPIPLIDADGYAMYAPGVYYDVSGNLSVGGYVQDENGYFIPVDSNFLLPITQVTNGHAQDADGNYYGVITLNGNPVYCYLGANGRTSGYTGYYQIDGNNFLVAATNVDADGFVKYNATDYYGTYNGISGYVDANGYFYDSDGLYYATDSDFTEVITKVNSNGYAMTADGRYYYGKGMVNNNAVYGLLDVRNGKKYLKVDGKYIAVDGNSYDFIDDEGRIINEDRYCYGTNGELLDSNGYVYDVNKGYTYTLPGNWSWLLGNYTKIDSEGYYVNDAGERCKNYRDLDSEGNPKYLKAWGYQTPEEIMSLEFGQNEWNYTTGIPKSGTFLKAVEGGEYISVTEGTKNQAISSADINGIEGEFIALQDAVKFAVVKDSDELDSVTVGEGKKVKFNAFIGGIALPNNAIWFKPSQSGTLKFVMFADSDANGFALMRIYRGTEKRDPASDDFFGVVNYDTDMGFSWEKLIMQKLPKGVLFYYEFEISQDEIDMGNIEYILCQQGTGGAHFLYLDIGSSAAEDDNSGIDTEKNVSAVDFIYSGVTISDIDDAGGAFKVGDFVINGTRYEASQTSVYFENMQATLNIYYVRLSGSSDGKTIKATASEQTTEIKATDTTKFTLLLP